MIDYGTQALSLSTLEGNTMTDNDTQEITSADSGTWLSGAMGWHNSYRVIDCAVSYGMRVDADDTAITYAYAGKWETLTLSTGQTLDADDIRDAVTGQGELADKATEYLEGKAPSGYEFVWDMGELNLCEVSWGCSTCAFEVSAVNEEEAEKLHAAHDGAHRPDWIDRY